MSTPRFPISPRESLAGIVYLPRMFDKIRLHAAGELGPDYHANLGQSFDAHACAFLGLSYEDIRALVLASGDDAEVLANCFQAGKQPSAQEVTVWNAYMSKWGWRDEGSERLVMRKAQSGLSDRDDIQCFFDYLDADEGRL